MDNGKIKTKKPFLTRDFVIAGVLFSGVVALFVLGIAGISDEYDSTILVNEDFAEKYDKLTQQTNRIETARETTAAGSGLSFLGTFDVAFSSTFVVFQMIFQSLGLFGDMSDSFAGDFGLDPTVMAVIFIVALSILTTLIVWNIVSSISRGRI